MNNLDTQQLETLVISLLQDPQDSKESLNTNQMVLISFFLLKMG